MNQSKKYFRRENTWITNMHILEAKVLMHIYIFFRVRATCVKTADFKESSDLQYEAWFGMRANSCISICQSKISLLKLTVQYFSLSQEYFTHNIMETSLMPVSNLA
jgi:hypothetical protein